MSIDDYTKEGDQLSMFDPNLKPSQGYNPEVERRKNQERMDELTKETIRADMLRMEYLRLKTQYEDLSSLVEGLNKNVDAEPVEKLRYLATTFPRFRQGGKQPLHVEPLQKIPALYKNLTGAYAAKLATVKNEFDAFKEKNPSLKY